jgi:hypothetical protein
MKVAYQLDFADIQMIKSWISAHGVLTTSDVLKLSSTGVLVVEVDPLTPVPGLPIPGHCVQVNPPLSVTGQATLFGLNWNGSVDQGDNGSGFFIDPSTGTNYVTSVQTLGGVSLPREVMLSTFLKIDDWTTDGIDSSWSYHASSLIDWVRKNHPLVTIDSGGFSAVSQPIVDAGPSAGTDNAIDLTYLTAHALSTQGDASATYMVLLGGHPMPIRGWDFVNNRVGLIKS